MQLCHETPDFSYSDFLTFQTLVPKLQNLGSAIGVGLLKFFVRC